MSEAVTARSFLQKHDPNLGLAADTPTGRAVAASAQTMLADDRVDFHAAVKYGRLVRCYGYAFADLGYLSTWSQTSRSVDAEDLWSWVSEEARWRGLSEMPLSEFAELLKSTACEPGTLEVWATKHLVAVVESLIDADKTAEIAKSLPSIIRLCSALPQEVVEDLMILNLSASIALNTGVQAGMSSLPRRGVITCRFLWHDAWTARLAAVNSLIKFPAVGTQHLIGECLEQERHPIVKHRLKVAAAALESTLRVKQRNLKDLVDECIDLDTDQSMPQWIREDPPPTVKWTAPLREELGEAVDARAVMGMIVGAYRRRFHGDCPDLDFLRQHIELRSWLELCEYALGCWTQLLRRGFECDDSRLINLKQNVRRPLRELPRAAAFVSGLQSPYVDALEAGGLLAFLTHACPARTTVRVWHMLTQRFRNRIISPRRPSEICYAT